MYPPRRLAFVHSSVSPASISRSSLAMLRNFTTITFRELGFRRRRKKNFGEKRVSRSRRPTCFVGDYDELCERGEIFDKDRWRKSTKDGEASHAHKCTCTSIIRTCTVRRTLLSSFKVRAVNRMPRVFVQVE